MFAVRVLMGKYWEAQSVFVECMYVNERETGVTVTIQRVQVMKEDNFKYLDSTTQSNGQSKK